ncbi:2-dehydro-3-deoxy-6-phosphogalactonate aldolase [Erythrobacter sp. F6033]|uniref:2-dehydro-3-deoxy-6-phosphogalactonate aldolase n=1 Tax=Erythrobacter sp. F6033 TaxID=2926401 RepID=UPI001FF3E488|nr:2-dehydro-3-deoxy-6-phosphogalactonate aldolase [Erythrobacter sp. F6033]MCK0129282.1 2-dehydro-3-deoxy-6-phosphogalactonate aldolase [Erythrobacter sp. F6033]
MTTIEDAIAACPLVAILRGVKPEEVVAIGEELYSKGFRCIEVPLNSPDPYKSIKMLTDAIPADCITGAGTVLTVEHVKLVREAGGRIIVSPNFNADVVRETVKSGMISLPGVATPTEAFAAIEAGANWLKVFPASTYGSDHIKAMKSVLPTNARIVVTGGVSAETIQDWRKAGVDGYGIGGELYRKGDTVDAVSQKAEALRAATGM